MKKFLSLLLCCMLLLTSLTAFAEAPATVTGKVTEIEKYGHALLDVKIADFLAAGFTLGDVVTVKAGTFEGEMPFFDGYYVDKGAMMVRAYPGHECIAVCINYGKFAETAGIGIGDEVTITLTSPAAALDVQVMNSLVYTNERADYATDEIFANFRMVQVGGIGEGKLYRAASPINNENNRAAISNALVAAAGVKAVMNMGDTAEEVTAYIAAEDFNSAYYADLFNAGKVITLGMPVNYDSDEFAAGIVAGLTFLSENEGPYLVHCTEGKDRAGFTSMLLGALMGGSVEELVADYMTSYTNYYGIDPVVEADKYNMIAEKNVMDMIRVVCGLEKNASLEGVDLAAGAESYLLKHGMTAEAIAALKANLQ